MTRRFLDLADAGADAVRAMLAEAHRRKAARAGWPRGRPDEDRPLDGHVLAMLFEKNSTRTRVSFDMAMRQLGGTTVVLDAASTQLGRGEPIADTARVLSRYVDAVMIRTDVHGKAEELATYADVPVVNGLTDLSHPCQVMADLQTVEERLGRLAGTRWAWLGDGNNMAHSIVEAGSLLGFDVTLACPEGHDPDEEVMALARGRGGDHAPRLTRDPAAAGGGAAGVGSAPRRWMGPAPAAAKRAGLAPFRVTEALMAGAGPDALFLHCLPAHRGEEVVPAVIDGPRSAIWDEAENRLHAQKAVLLWCLGKL